jgi:hypothetical protein
MFEDYWLIDIQFCPVTRSQKKSHCLCCGVFFCFLSARNPLIMRRCSRRTKVSLRTRLSATSSLCLQDPRIEGCSRDSSTVRLTDSEPAFFHPKSGHLRAVLPALKNCASTQTTTHRRLVQGQVAAAVRGLRRGRRIRRGGSGGRKALQRGRRAPWHSKRKKTVLLSMTDSEAKNYAASKMDITGLYLFNLNLKKWDLRRHRILGTFTVFSVH